MRLPDKFTGYKVASVYIHLSFEDYRPMVMEERPPEKPIVEE